MDSWLVFVLIQEAGLLSCRSSVKVHRTGDCQAPMRLGWAILAGGSLARSARFLGFSPPRLAHLEIFVASFDLETHLLNVS
jgi:hypothetical protein